MTPSLFRLPGLGLLLWVLLAGAGPVAAGPTYTLSMLPRYFPEKLTAMISPLAQYLTRETGLTVQVMLTKNFEQYEDKIRDKDEIAIGYENPVVYLNVMEKHVVIAKAMKGEGGDRFRGIIITRPDSPIKTIADLPGKTVMIVGRTSAGGYLSQKLTLKEKGITLDEDKLVVAADNRQENVLIAVSVGDVDAGFIRESALHKADRYIVPNSIKVLATTAWLPNWALSVSRSMPAADRKKIQQALLALKKDGPVLKAMGLRGFKKATDDDYLFMRDVL